MNAEDERLGHWIVGTLLWSVLLAFASGWLADQRLLPVAILVQVGPIYMLAMLLRRADK